MKRLRLILGTIALVGVIYALPIATSAKISDVDISCSNPAGHAPSGQQPSCQNGTLTQETESQNPAGHAPPGQN